MPKTLAPGDAYPGAEALAQRLQLLGDLPQGPLPDAKPGIYEGALVDGVKHFQSRHGLGADGRLGKDTLVQLNTPLSVRVQQLDDALERWRWLPADFSPLPVAVNIPEFVLRVFSPDHRIAMRMNVVVGKAVRNETPVFAEDMKYIIFRPYWNVPLSITRGEIIPALQKDSGYLAKKNFEVTDQSGNIVTSGAVSADVLAQLRSGKLLVRQRPGPANSLGLIKFIFPNEHNVYLHSTPAQSLFSQSRRDFSHGCIRVEKPAELAAWLLQDQPKWTVDAVKAAMQSGPDNQQVNLTTPVPVVIIYLTAVVEENGEVYFFDDIYGHDQRLNAVLAKGPPYPISEGRLLPAANAAYVYVNKIGLRVIAHSAAAHRQRRIADLSAGDSWNANIDGLGFHVLAVFGNPVAMLPQVVVAPRGPIPADNVDFAVGVSQLDQQIVQQIEFLEVIILHVTGAVVAQKMVQLRNTVRQVLIADPIDHIDMFAGVQVIEAQPVGSSIRWGPNIAGAAWEYT